jgi:hypothetical protein
MTAAHEFFKPQAKCSALGNSQFFGILCHYHGFLTPGRRMVHIGICRAKLAYGAKLDILGIFAGVKG